MTDISGMDSYLEHYGVKGMKWGVINEDQPIGRKKGKSTPELSPLEKSVLTKAAAGGLTKDRASRQFGPNAPKPPASVKKDFQLTEAQKKAIKIGVGVAIGAGALYGLNKYGTHLLVKQNLGEFGDNPNMVSFWKAYSKRSRGAVLSERDIRKLSTEAFEFKPGSILQRISSKREGSIRPGGFYAAFKDEDVARYKAALPVFWKQWGMENADGHGYVVKLKAKSLVKAPSQKETFDLLVDFLDTKDPKGGKYRDYFDHNVLLRELGLPGRKEKSSRDLARESYKAVMLNLNDNNDDVTKGFFKFLASKGYGAIVDGNDAGKLSDSPLRVFKPENFEIAGTAKLSKNAILKAQREFTDLKHEDIQEMDTHLAHYGVKGMKWGKRKNPKRKHSSKDFNRTKNLRGQKPRTLSDRELKEINARINLETKYKQMNPNTVKRGETQVKAALATASIASATYTFVKSPLGKDAIALGKKIATGK